MFLLYSKGAVIKLPKNATSIDFYAVHTKIGDTATGCKINGKNSQLRPYWNGDMVEITTSKNVSPSLHWLSSSKTGKAKLHKALLAR